MLQTFLLLDLLVPLILEQMWYDLGFEGKQQFAKAVEKETDIVIQRAIKVLFCLAILYFLSAK
jgi:hypothetical protein